MSKTSHILPKSDHRQLDIFYNTTHMTADTLKVRRASANRQNQAILKFFKDNPAGFFTPFEVQLYAGLRNIPITSIRRAINSLTDAGFIVKTDNLRPGDFGAMNHTWTLAKS